MKILEALGSIAFFPLPVLLALGGIVLIILALVTVKKSKKRGREEVEVLPKAKARAVAFVTGCVLVALSVFLYRYVPPAQKGKDGDTQTNPPPLVGRESTSTLPIYSGMRTEAEPVPTESLVTLYETDKAYHLGDEVFSGWGKLVGDCLTIAFQVPAMEGLILYDLTLHFETFGVDEGGIVKVNGEEVLIITSVQGLPMDAWSGSRTLPIPVSLLKRDGNRLDICAAPVVADPSFPGDKDDFQIRNIKIVAKYRECR